MHHNYYKEMLADEEGVKALDVELTEEENSYLHSIMESNVMKYQDELIEKAKVIWKEEDAFIIADKIERETILLVYEILQLYPDFSPELMEKILINNLNQKEFFINKAIGWALRDYSKTNPEWVRTFIENNKEKMSKLSIKEGSKYI